MGTLVGLSPNKALSTTNVKHYKSVDFLSNFRVSSTPEETSSPPTADLVTVLLVTKKGKE